MIFKMELTCIGGIIMSSALLKIYNNFEMANNIPIFSVKKFDVEASFSMASMICGDCGGDCSCDTEGDDQGCGCNV